MYLILKWLYTLAAGFLLILLPSLLCPDRLTFGMNEYQFRIKSISSPLIDGLDMT
jgi:H+/Cl- antiporter ClcA